MTEPTEPPTDLAGFIVDVVLRREAALAELKACDEILIQARSSIPNIRRRQPVNGKPKKSPGRPRRPVADPAAEWRTQPKVTPPDVAADERAGVREAQRYLRSNT